MPPRDEKLATLARLRAVVGGSNGDPKAWARQLRDREAGGERLGQAQREVWRMALRMEASAVAEPERVSGRFVAPEDLREVA
jgi:hypothetical protein